MFSFSCGFFSKTDYTTHLFLNFIFICIGNSKLTTKKRIFAKLG